MSEIIPNPYAEGERFVEDKYQYVVGQWYWVKDEDKQWFGCVIHVGSNYVELRGLAFNGTQYNQKRVHFDEAQDILRLEQDHKGIIAKNIEDKKREIEHYLNRVKEIVADLGVSNECIEHTSANTSLAKMSDATDISSYKNALIKAKNEDLPALHDKIKSANNDLTAWLSAESIPMMALINVVQKAVDDVEGRIFNVSIYAGISEQVKQFADGMPASNNEPLHILQRKLYMDEECLLCHDTGGLDINDLEEFHRWLSKKDNRDRILPFQRCLVAFQIRRNIKEREWDGSFGSIIRIMNEESSDKLTYLIIRNGERLYQLKSDLEFGDLIFPSKNDLDLSEPMMVRSSYDKVELMPVREYEYLKNEEIKRRQDVKREAEDRREWIRLNVGPEPGHRDPARNAWRDKMDECPHGGYFHHTKNTSSGSFSYESWEPLNQDTVYLDDATDKLTNEIKQYNRIVLIIQGILDRSDILHPHPPVKTWNYDSFNENIKLVYDGSNVLHYGEAPDIDEYIANGRKLLDKNSVVIGQQYEWESSEAEKYEGLIWRRTGRQIHMNTYKPLGNNGPGYLARIKNWRPRVRQATFAWYREAVNDYYSTKNPVRCTFTVDADNLFNVSAYKPGDFKKFFEDPRTRAEYLKWARIMLTAEDYHAGKITATEPESKTYE